MLKLSLNLIRSTTKNTHQKKTKISLQSKYDKYTELTVLNQNGVQIHDPKLFLRVL